MQHLERLFLKSKGSEGFKLSMPIAILWAEKHGI